MKITGGTLSLYVDIPESEISIFKYLAHKMGWKIHVSKENEETLNLEEEKKLFFENSKHSMAKYMEKYLSE